MPVPSFFSRTATYAPFVLRASLSLVILWFGVQQVIAPDMWVSWVPVWAYAFGISPETLVLTNGSFEVLAGVLLLAGISTRIVAFVLFLHMTLLVREFGATPVGVRDFGLAMGLLTLALDDRSKWSLF
ncbi:MAG: hypothetical protein Athens041674_868 [Parcubacteria group bacterium Athens0416_74]|nr:MAG: hypothetical protein Athens041674_868 [Parcubacteria group bacterium Athens0416_74]